MKSKRSRFTISVILAALILLFCLVESRPYEVRHSSVLSSENRTDARLYIIANTLLPIDREEFARQVVESHTALNGPRPNQYFELKIYRTSLHYRLHKCCVTISCDENGTVLSTDP